MPLTNTYSKLLGTIRPVNRRSDINEKNAVLVSKKALMTIGCIHNGII